MCAGETVATDDSIRDHFFTTIYGLISESAQNNGPAQGSNFWNLYTVGIADDDPYKVTLADNSTMAIVAAHVSPFLCAPLSLHMGTGCCPATLLVHACQPDRHRPHPSYWSLPTCSSTMWLAALHATALTLQSAWWQAPVGRQQPQLLG